jgi:hypothetical protein
VIAWDVKFKRDRYTPEYKAERLVIVTLENRLQQVLDALRERYPAATVEAMETLGEALVAVGIEGDGR